MPELPEVESLARFLAERAVGRTVAAVEIGAISALKTFSPPPSALVGRPVVGIVRHGKWLDLATGAPSTAGTTASASDPSEPHELSEPHDAGPHLVWHLARAGWVRWYDSAPVTPLRPGRSPIALRLRLDDGAGFDLTEAGTRRRLAVHVVDDPAEVEAVAVLGIDPLGPDLTVERLVELAASRNQQLKGMLRDQRQIAGIGNAYSDEILHAAGMSPFTLSRSLDPETVTRLHTVIGEVLSSALEAAGGRRPACRLECKDAKRRGMRVHGRAGQPCPVCGDTVREVSFADSSLQYCPTCQTGGKTLADRRMSRLLR